MMDWREYYLREVYPRLEIPLAEKYPTASLLPRAGFRPLGEQALLMLVALTGTGKSTTLELLRGRLSGGSASVIPSRREIADWIAIPTAQTLAGEPIVPAPDRKLRFAYTGKFAEHVPGGMAAAFSWLYLADDRHQVLLSEGIRGENEIRYALRHFPRWQIVELSLNPLTRLRRLSGRRDEFDRAGGSADISFLPSGLQREALALFKAGEITGEALAIVQAESVNYGFDPFADGRGYANYHHIDVDGLSPAGVADAVRGIMVASNEAGRERATCQQ
ncbi:MAG: hypothetical protein OXI30_07685 [Chloroflexota bacterium]|nr:hypothetical protein [Chloroflexota bacterium]